MYISHKTRHQQYQSIVELMRAPLEKPFPGVLSPLKAYSQYCLLLGVHLSRLTSRLHRSVLQENHENRMAN